MTGGRTARVLGGTTLALALATVLAGCGGEGAKVTDSAAHFKEQATAVCARAHQDLLTVGSGIKDSGSPTQTELAEAASKIAVYLKTELDGLKALQPPSAQSTAYEQLLTSLAEVITTAEQKGAAFINPETRPFSAFDSGATALGLDACVH